jgi:tRNA threonylcarbamoyl adenosine modification protein YeaZ
MQRPISIAIETSCRNGGVALGAGEELLDVIEFQSQRRHAVQLVPRLKELLGRHGLTPAGVHELYVSAGPGSFTGLRLGITVARTMGQMLPDLKLVAVPTALAVAEGLADAEWQNLAVLMDSKDQAMYAAVFQRHAGGIVPVGEPQVITVDEVAKSLSRPCLLAGEALEQVDVQGGSLSKAIPEKWLPSVKCVWRVGRRLATADQYTSYGLLRPIYSRRPEAERLWDARGHAEHH